MKINVFEGARRIMRVVAVLSALVIFFFSVESPRVKLSFTIAGPGERPNFDPSPKWHAYNRKISKVLWTPKGDRAEVDFVFLARKTNDGTEVVPYRREAGKEWADHPYSDEVTAYTKQVIESFTFSQGDEEWISRQWWKIGGRNLGLGVVFVVLSLLFLNVISRTTGWIVRGFFGIPSGMDSKLEKPAKIDEDEATS
jgi:hypothetical protein